MSRVERVGALSFSRIKGAYVERQRGSASVGRPLPVEAAIYAQNNSDWSSENHLIAYDNYYRNLNKLEKEFDNFLKDPKYIKEEVEKERKKKKPGKRSDLYRRVRALINKYNVTIDALVYIDKNYNTNNIKELNFIVLNHEENLRNLGIVIKNLKMEINGGVFWKNFLESQDPYEEMFHPLARLIMALFIKFRNIMVVRKNQYNSFSEDYKGTIINQSY